MAATALETNRHSAATLARPTEAVIDGRVTAPRAGGRFANIGPVDGAKLGDVAACDAGDVDAAVASARAAFEDRRWRGQKAKARKQAMHALADILEKNADELALLETLDMGKPIAQARGSDIPGAIDTFRYYAEALDKVYGETGPSNPNRLSYTVHEPLGVIGAIVPWNFPLLMAAWKVAPALAMGNSVVLKPAEQSPMTAIRLGELALEAGLPAGVLNVIPGTGAVAGQALARHMDVDMLAFTGSTRVGRQLMGYSGESNLKRVSLELGGKSPQIVFADCPDMEAAAEAAAWGIFYNQGQVCTAASRLLVHEDIRAGFVARVVEIARTIVPGDPLDPATSFGAMVSESQMRTALGYIDKAGAEGDKALLFGGRVREETGGYYVAPTIFETTPGSTLAKEEVFGPVLGVIGFRDDEEAYRIANDTIYGLAAGVWTANVDRAHKAADRLRAGMVWVNGWDSCDITMPFGGFKQSGFGRDRSLHAMEKYADLKAVTLTLR